MKKLMIAAAIVCAAAMSQAATYEWNVAISSDGAAYKADGTTLFSGQAYIFNGETIGQEALWNAIVGGTALDTLATTYGAVGIELASGYNDTPVKMYTDQSFGEEQTFMLVMKDGNNFFIDDQEYADASTMPGGKDVYLDVSWTAGGEYVFDVKDGYASSGGWYTAAAVPEPTSGLLLLLGVAGLALKRKRA